MSLWRFIKKLIIFDFFCDLFGFRSHNSYYNHYDCNDSNLNNDDYLSQGNDYHTDHRILDDDYNHSNDCRRSCGYDYDQFGYREIDDYYDGGIDMSNDDFDFDGDGW